MRSRCAARRASAQRALIEVQRRNPAEQRPKPPGGLLTEAAFEARLRARPERKGSGQKRPPGRRHRHDTAAAILFRHPEGHETALLERDQKMPERRSIHDEKLCEILNRAGAGPSDPRQD
jgi:hypothetical protein